MSPALSKDGPSAQSHPGLSAGIHYAIYVLFFFSGMAGLVYEVTWIRMFVSVFGNTTYAISAVLSAFMAGLALGSILFGRFIDTRSDELKVYALLELGIGLTALAVPTALRFLDVFYAQVYQPFSSSPWALTTVRTVLSFLLLLLPTSLMGATLPVLSKYAVERPSQVPMRVGLLYALNTLGAAWGCFVTGFLFLEFFGIRGSSYLAVGGSFSLALAFGLLSRMEKASAPLAPSDRRLAAPAAPEQIESRYAILILGVAALSGFASLGYEVLWSRLLVFKLKTTTYAFAIMLTTFLSGIGLGSALLAAIEGKFKLSNYARVLGWIEAAIGLLGIGSIYLFAQLDRFFGPWASSWSVRTGEQMLSAAFIMFPSTLLMGAAFPVCGRLYAQCKQKIGTSIGGIYSSNTLGSVLGALVTGFFLVRFLGTQNSLILMGLLNLGIATAVLYFEPYLRQDRGRHWQLGPALAFWSLAAVAILALPRDLLFQFYNTGEKEMNSQVQILHAIEGIEGITTIHQLPSGNRLISTGSINVAGTILPLRSTQKLQGHIPMLVHSRPERVLQIGFGSGETAHILTTYPIQQLDVAEISQSVLDAAARYFRDLNHGVTTHPKFSAFIMDGANYLRFTDRRYDVIMNDSIWPFYAGNSGLYTREHFLAGREHLRPGGMMTSWLPLDMRPESFEIILKTFHSVFPYFSVWVTTTHYTKHALLLGSEEPLHIDVVGFLEKFDQYAQEDLAAVDLADPVLLLDCFMASETTLAGELEDVPLHTLDRPILEFDPSKPAYTSQLPVYKMLARHHTSVLPYLDNIEDLGKRRAPFESELRTIYRATGHVLKGMIMREERQAGFEREFDQALQLRPDHPGAISGKSYRDYLHTLDLGVVEGRSYRDLIGLADRLTKAGLYDRAVDVLEKASEIEPDNPQIYHEMGLVLVRANRLKAATKQFEQALALDPEFAATYTNLGNLLNRQGRFEEAMVQYRQALKFDPALAEAHFGLGMVLHAQGKTEEAIHELKEALHLEPDYFKAHINLGVLLDSQGRSDEAIEHFQQAIRLAPDDPNTYNNLVIGLILADRVDEAREYLNQADQRRISLPVARQALVKALITLARFHAEKGELLKAITRQRQAIALTPAKLQTPLREQLRDYESRR